MESVIPVIENLKGKQQKKITKIAPSGHQHITLISLFIIIYFVYFNDTSLFIKYCYNNENMCL